MCALKLSALFCWPTQHVSSNDTFLYVVVNCECWQPRSYNGRLWNVTNSTQRQVSAIYSASCFYRATQCKRSICCRHVVSVYVSVILGYCINTAKFRIAQTMPQDSPGTLVLWCQSSWQNSNGITLPLSFLQAGCPSCQNQQHQITECQFLKFQYYVNLYSAAH